MATYRIINQYPGGFQGEVTVRPSSAAISRWTVRWNFANGQTITQLWSGEHTVSGSQVTVNNLPYNGSIAANGSTTFGFNGTWNGTNAVPSPITCS